MAVTSINGAEGQDTKIDIGVLIGTASYSTSTVRTGSASYRCNPASGASGYVLTAWSATVGFLHVAMNIATLPSVSRVILGDISGGHLKLTSTGTLAYYNAGALVGTSTTALTPGTWYWVGVDGRIGGSGALVQIDGTTEISGTASSGGVTSSVGFGANEASAVDAYFDDMIRDDAGFLNPSKVALLVPISDNARSAEWTGGAGGTTDLFDAVNNTPPIGTATETNLTQIEHAGGATGSYDANMTTYAAAGVGSGDTVLAILYLIAHGEDIATGTKLLNFSLVSNPIQASGLADFDVASTSGALGTYPTGWFITRNTIVASPSVTVGTSPVMRVTRPETASRVASVCFMGMYVAWTPQTGTNAAAGVAAGTGQAEF